MFDDEWGNEFSVPFISLFFFLSKIKYAFITTDFLRKAVLLRSFRQPHCVTCDPGLLVHCSQVMRLSGQLSQG